MEIMLSHLGISMAYDALDGLDVHAQCLHLRHIGVAAAVRREQADIARFFQRFAEYIPEMGGIAGQAGLGAFPDELVGGIPQLDGTGADIQRHRNIPDILKQNNGISAQLMFRADEETKTLRFPFDFEFTSVFTLDGHTLHHEVHVKNCGDENMRCGIGFHPGFNIPFDENHTTTDYEIRFEQEESPIILDCLPHGLLSGKSFYQWKNTQAIPLTDTLFDNDSFCLAGLRSKTIGIYEKNSERKIICDISEYPYTLLWSAPTKPMRFICIEPWQSLPAAETDTSEWNEHAAAACIAPNESYSITLHTTFER